MFVDGTLGIGTVNPQYTLQVNNNLSYFPSGVDTPGYHAQFTLCGGGKVTWSGTSLLWSSRVLAIPIEKTEFGSVGYVDISCCISGTITYYDSTNATTTKTCDASGIPLSNWEALWYIVTPGQSNTSVQAQFVITNYQNSNWRPTSNWILIALKNGDDSLLKWMPGNSFLYSWLTPAFQNGWLNYDAFYNQAGYYRDTSNRVYLRGLVRTGTANTTIFTLPSGYRPVRRELFCVMSNGAIARVDVLIDGQVLMMSGSNVWISLDRISFLAV
jgi:hypothetical protein